MKIGLFTDAYLPIVSGVAVSVNILYKELTKLGHDVYVFTNEHPNAEEDDHVIRFKGQYLPMKGMNEYQVSKVSKSKIDKVSTYHLDVIHCHTEFTMGRLGRKAARKYNIPVVHTYHTMYEDYIHHITKTFARPLRFASKIYSKSFANSADEVIFPTIKVKKTFDKYGYNKPCNIIPTGIYLDKFMKINYKEEEIKRLKDSLEIKEDHFVCLFLGRLSREKSVDTLIEHFAKLAKNDPSLLLLIVGGGPDAEIFFKMVKDLGIEDKVIFTGMVPPNEVGFYYHLADLFMNFSITETQGLTYTEALASGLPLLVKYDDNLEGVIVPHYNGLCFDKDEEFVDKFHELTSNKVKFLEISTNASKAIEKFSAQTYALSVMNVYAKVI